MATKVENPLDINKQLYDELQRTYPEVRADVIVHVMTEVRIGFIVSRPR